MQFPENALSERSRADFLQPLTGGWHADKDGSKKSPLETRGTMLKVVEVRGPPKEPPSGTPAVPQSSSQELTCRFYFQD